MGSCGSAPTVEDSDPRIRSTFGDREEGRKPSLEYRRMSTTEAWGRAEGRREAAPAALLILLVFAGLAPRSWSRGWELLGLAWWIWLVLGLPALLLDDRPRAGFSWSRLGPISARRPRTAQPARGRRPGRVVDPRGGLVTSSTSDLSGGELLLSAFAIYTTDVIVFGLLYWELDGGGPEGAARRSCPCSGRLPLPAGRPAGAVASGCMGPSLRVADELDRVQPDRHDAAVPARKGVDGARVCDIRGHGAARRGACRERARLLTSTRTNARCTRQTTMLRPPA